MIFQARKTRLARIWMRFYGADKDFSHEKLGLENFRQIAEQEIEHVKRANLDLCSVWRASKYRQKAL